MRQKKLSHIQKKIPSKKNFRTEAGFSLIEIIVAAAIISLSLVSIIQIAGQALIFSRQSTDLYVASDYLEEGAEAVRTIRDNGWINISTLTPNLNYYLSFDDSTNSWWLSATASSTATSTLPDFSRTVTFSPVMRDSNYNISTSTSGTIDPNTSLVTVTVSWLESTGMITKQLSFYLSNIFS